MDHFKEESKWKSKSVNPAVRDLYGYILDNQESDSDYWDHSSVEYKLDSFMELDRKELEVDLKYWSNEQLEIFTHCLMTSYTYNLPSGEYKGDACFFDELMKTLPYKVDLILPLLKIGIDRGRLKNDIAMIVGDEIFFLVNHFKVLMNYDKKYLNIIKTIVEVLEWCSEDLKLLIEEAEKE